MIEKNDWRLQGDEECWKNERFFHKKYTPYHENWEHDHCAFCSVKISEYEDDLHEGYCTLDQYHWVCSECFEDFKEMFCWQVVND